MDGRGTEAVVGIRQAAALLTEYLGMWALLVYAEPRNGFEAALRKVRHRSLFGRKGSACISCVLQGLL